MRSLWTSDHTMAYLNANPLPPSFKWKHRDYPETRAVQPTHKTVKGYGKWLRETPYFQGLFEQIHDILSAASEVGDGDWMVEELAKKRVREQQTKLPL